MAEVKVLLVDDDALVRAGLQLILSSAEDLVVVGEVDDGTRAVAAVREHRPDVVLMDIRMAEMDGITATAALRRLDEPPHVIVLTTFQADEQVMSALRAGASGFLLKDVRPAELVHAIRAVASGDAVISPRITRKLLDTYAGELTAGAAGRPVTNPLLARLTPRELDIVRLVGKGLGNKRIAHELGVSVTTVRTHLNRVYDKLGPGSRVELALYAAQAGGPVM